jgi:hypothetical protein
MVRFLRPAAAIAILLGAMKVALAPVLPDSRMGAWAVALIAGVVSMMSTEARLSGTREATKRTFGYVLSGAALGWYVYGVVWAAKVMHSWVLFGVVNLAMVVFVWLLKRGVNLRYGEWPTTKAPSS